MLDGGGIIDQIGVSLIVGAVTLWTSVALLKKEVKGHDDRFKEVEDGCKECRNKTEGKFNDGVTKFQTLEINLMAGINDIKLQIARIESRNDLGKEIADNLIRAAASRKGNDQ